MKKLKLDHTLAQQVVAGTRASTWRLFDDKDLSVNDEVLLIDKVDPKDPNSWKAIGTATIDKVMQHRLGDIGPADMDEGHNFPSQEAMLATYQRYYGPNVTLQTPVKIIHFHFSPNIPSTLHSDIMPRVEKVIVYADGGSRGNPGPSASGYVIYDENHQVLVYRGTYIGVTTNNQAEYMALKLALEEAKSLGAQQVSVYMDSLLVVNQMRGIFKVKNRDLWPVHDAAEQLVKQFDKVLFTQVPRESNKLADAAVNQALDQQLQYATPHHRQS